MIHVSHEINVKPISAYHVAIDVCLDRYWEMLTSVTDDYDFYGWPKNCPFKRTQSTELKKFIVESMKACADEMPINKLNRWLGYIQGMLIAWGITTVEDERNFSRPLFRPLDFPEEV